VNLPYEKWGAGFGLLGAFAEVVADLLFLVAYMTILDFLFALIPDLLNLALMMVYLMVDFVSSGSIPEPARKRAIHVRRASLLFSAVIVWASALARFWFGSQGLVSQEFWFAASLAGPVNILLLLAISLVVYGST